jgi:NCAIR mutase (PurE)-related protein
MIVQQGGRERQTSSHILERVIPNHVELGEREPIALGQPLLFRPNLVHPPIEVIEFVRPARQDRYQIPITAVTAHDHYVTTHAPEPDGQEKCGQKGDKRDCSHDPQGEGQLILSEIRHGRSSYTDAMRPEEVKQLLTRMKEGNTTVEQALKQLRTLPFEDLGFARLDTHRELRQGLPEAVYAEGKTAEHVVAIAARLLSSTTSPVLVTRTTPESAAALAAEFPNASINDTARTVVLRSVAHADVGRVSIVTAGTSDLPVAEEAAVTASAFGAEVDRINDVGIAGLHRVLAVQDLLHSADVVIVVAGMEGALATLVGGITPAPVVAVPTSVGYGASFDGLAALLAMLNSCAAGVVVVNIDNGFGAAVAALRLLQAKRR